ncbi:MAG: DUF748 domain-containing protein [Tatlockia sp.]|nr:DUF748 domain-containing protein [Tatlockia sp.]
MRLIGLMIVGGIILIASRLALPYALIHYAENRINKIPLYHVKIEDIDVSLWRGSYSIKNLKLNKINKNIPVPFFSAEQINLAIEWPALLHGSIVGKIKAIKPKLNFVIEPNNKDQQLSIDKEWQLAVSALFPLNFNKISIENGEISLHSFSGKPPFQLSLHDIDFELKNLQKVTAHKSLYSTFSGQAAMSKGRFTVSGQVDPDAKKPTFLLKSSLKSMQIQGANDFLLNYTHFDVKQGELSVFTEIAAAKGKIHGYLKPIIKNLQVINPKEKMNPIKFIYKGLIATTAKLVTNHKKHTVATKIKIEGNLEDPETHIFSIIGYVLKHAFIQALLPDIDHSIEIKDLNFTTLSNKKV